MLSWQSRVVSWRFHRCHIDRADVKGGAGGASFGMLIAGAFVEYTRYVLNQRSCPN
jgi:hypothetical protein